MSKNKKNTIYKAVSFATALLFIWNHLCWAYPFQVWTLRPIATAKSQPDLVPSDSIFPKPQPLMKEHSDFIAPVELMEDEKAVGRTAAERIIEVAKETPDAVIVLSVNPSASLVCDALVERFQEAKDADRVDFSSIRFFVLSAYAGLAEGHPLNQSFFMKNLLYERLKAIDPARAPRMEHINIPFLEINEEPEQAARRYEQALQQSVSKTGRGRIDLVVSGIGSAYPEYDGEGRFIGLRGCSLGLNQSGSKPTDRTRAVKLQDHTTLDIIYLLKNLRSQSGLKKHYLDRAPTDGITIGIAEILESSEILLLAAGEESAPVIKKLYEGEADPHFPVTFLKYHQNASWVLDREAGYYLPHSWRPWKLRQISFEWNKEAVAQAVLVALAYNSKLTIDRLTGNDLQGVGVPEDVITRFAFGNLRGITAVRVYLRHFLRGSLHSESNDLLPKEGDEVILFSPRPDDDVINMAAIITMLAARGCKVTIAYLASGEETVRNSYAEARRRYEGLMKEFKMTWRRSPQADEKLELREKARAWTRRIEAKNALNKLLGPELMANVSQEFLNLSYYRQIGIAGIKPIDKKDVDEAEGLLERISADYIFFPAEKDPRGIHGLGAEIMARAIRQRVLHRQTEASKVKAPKLCGFRGAWQEWPLYQPENLTIVPFSSEVMRLKQEAIRQHLSQIFPIFPGPDSRRLWLRATERNRNTGRILEQSGILSEAGYPSGQVWYAEAFRIFPYEEFLTGLEDDGVIAVSEDGSSYSLTKGSGGDFTEEFRFGPGLDELRQEAAKEALLKQAFSHPDQEAQRLILEYSKEQIAPYLAGLAVSCEEQSDFLKAAGYWTKAMHRYLKEGQREKAIGCRNHASKNLNLHTRRYRQPLYSLRTTEDTAENALLFEALGGEFKDVATKRWAIASKAYNDLARKTQFADEKEYFYSKSAKCTENAARLDKELAEEETGDKARLERRRHQAKNMHLAAQNWFLAKRYNKALGCAREAFRLEHELGDEIFESMDLSAATHSCFLLGRFYEAIQYGLRSIRLNRRLSKDPKLDWKKRRERKIYLVRDLGLVAKCYLSNGSFDRAIKHGKRALALMETDGLSKEDVGLDNITYVYTTLSEANHFQGRCLEAGQYAARCAEVYLKEKNDPDSAADFLAFAGRNICQAGKYDKATEYYEHAAVLKEGLGDYKNALRDWAMLALCRAMLANSGINKMENYRKAGYADRRAAELSEAGGETEEAIRHYLFAEKNFDMGLLPEGREDCQDEAVRMLKGLVIKIQKGDPGIFTFRYLLDELEKRYPRIFFVEIRNYAEDAVSNVQYELREESRSSARRPDLTKGRDALSALASAA